MPKAAIQNEVGRLVTINEVADLLGMSREAVGQRLRYLTPVVQGSGPTPSKYNSLIALPVALDVIKV